MGGLILVCGMIVNDIGVLCGCCFRGVKLN